MCVCMYVHCTKACVQQACGNCRVCVTLWTEFFFVSKIEGRTIGKVIVILHTLGTVGKGGSY